MVGNNDVPYPVLKGKYFVYFMLDAKFLPIKYFDNLTELEFLNAYNNYYDGLAKKSEPMKNYLLINKRFY
jgi:hypothetical protein